MWRHEAYKLSMQKRALELESVAEIHRVLERVKRNRSDIVKAISHLIDTESAKFTDKLSLAFRRMSQRVDTLEDILTRSKLSAMRSSASQETHRRSQSSRITQLESLITSLQDHIQSDKERLTFLETENGQLRSALAAEKREHENEKSELLARVTREQRNAHDAELARREACTKPPQVTRQSTTPPRGEVAALIEELHALEAEAQRLVPRNQPR